MPSLKASSLLTCAVASAAILCTTIPPVTAGPPLVCHPVEISEDAKSLPFGEHAFDYDKSYDMKELVPDTLEILNDETPLLTRMETLRRAAIYAMETKQLSRAIELLSELQGRAMDAVAAGEEGELAWFDAGYFVQVCKQYGILSHRKKSIDGYAYVKRVAELEPKNPDLQFALAMICVYPKRPEMGSHLKQAIEGTSEDTLLAKNLEIHFNASFSELQDQYARR